MKDSTPKNTFGLNFVLVFFGVWLAWWFWLNTLGRLPNGLSWPSLLIFDGLAAAGVWFYFRRFKPESPRWPRLTLWSIPALIAFASAVFYCSLLIPHDWDGLTYHLPPLIEAYQKKQWGGFDNPFYAVQAYPKLVESLYLWKILHIGPTGLLLLGVIPIVLGSWAVARLAAFFGLRSDWAAALWCTIPIVVKEASSLYIDAFVGVFGICTVLAIALRRLDLFALSIALFVGSKPSAYIPAVILLGSWTLRSWMERPRENGVSLRWIPWIPAALSVAACLGTFIPNLIRYSNPIYPFQISLMGRVIFPGFSHAGAPGDFPSYHLRLSETNWLERMNYSYFKTAMIPYWDMIQGAMGIPLAALGAIGFFIVLIRILRAKRNPFGMPGVEFALGVPISRAIWMPRYHIWIGGGLILWACEAMRSFPRALRALVFVALLVQSLWLWTDRAWFMGLKPQYEEAIQKRDWSRVGEMLSDRWQELVEHGEPQQGKEPWDVYRIEARKRKGPSYVCGDGPQMLAALYGRDFKNEVIWMKADDPSGTCENGIWKPKPELPAG